MSIWPLGWTLTGNTTMEYSNELELHIHQNYKSGASPSGGFVSFSGY